MFSTTKKRKNRNYILTSIIILFVFFISSIAYFSYIYHNDESYKKILEINKSLNREKISGKLYFLAFKIIRKASDELNLARVYKKIKYQNPSTVNLEMSGADVSFIKEQINVFKKKGFIKDELNSWRKAKLKLDKKEYLIDFKFNGTSISPLKKDHFSLRIKYKKEQKINQIREFNLIKIYFDSGENIPTIIFNNLAKSFGLLSPSGETRILKINGVNVGFYYIQERHSKEWFEINEITNYSILKNNDDWDKKNESGHISDLDLNEKNIEISGNGSNPAIAYGAIKKLFDSVKEKNLEKIFQLIDKDYFAKYLAVLSIINDNHIITGDNVRYIYDFTNGKFKILFRQESGFIEPINSSIENFNKSLFVNNSFEETFTHDLFKLIISDKDFRFQKDLYLKKILTNKESIISEAENIYKEAFKNLVFSDVKLRHQKYLKIEFFNNLNHNFKKIDKYLNYSKVYVSIERKNNLNILSVTNDSFSPIKINAFIFDDKKKEIINSNEYIVPAIEYDGENFEYADYKLNIISDTKINKIEFQNIIAQKKIDDEHIYLNEIRNFDLTNKKSLILSLKNNGLRYDLNNSNLFIKKDNYIISENLIIPSGINTVIEKGTNFFIKKNISILFKGDLLAKGSENEIIKVKNYDKKFPFGTFATVSQNKKNNVILENFEIEGGSEAIVEGMVFLGQLSIHNSNVKILKSKINNSISDDGANIRNSNIEISNTVFNNNKFDHLDLDFCNGILENNLFIAEQKTNKLMDNNESNLNGDGIDLSGSKVIIKNNTIISSSDKAISVGEKSLAIIKNNYFKLNNIAIAIKDESKTYIFDNKFDQNKLKFSMYVKKYFFDMPTLYLNKENYIQDNIKSINEKNNIKEGNIYFIENKDKEEFYNNFKNDVKKTRI
jgi:hypothetical protein